MQEDAGDGVVPVGLLDALVGREVVRGGLMGQHDGEALRGQALAKSAGKRDGGILFKGVSTQVRA